MSAAIETRHSDLLDVDPFAAVREKSRRGRVAFAAKGHDEYVGGHPLHEAYEEVLDLGAYLLMALDRSDNDSELTRTLVMETLNLIQGVATAAKGVRR